ncbi:type II toxin-antitoxin system RelE/ParE family toxin [Pseudomonas sp. G.S.17]|uniref:type II toxin-antitoxin system RelE/ParE family toxin n=1 Tax=Pseudomonas sp. G.S.17 TaxID=3137451 RepID=UPI00311C9490
MSQYRISNAARTDIVDILRASQAQFGDAARHRYQILILTALQEIAALPQRIGTAGRDDIAPGLRSYHLTHSRQNARQSRSYVKKPRHIVFYRVDDDVIDVVRLLHDAMDVQLHFPEEQ